MNKKTGLGSLEEVYYRTDEDIAMYPIPSIFSPFETNEKFNNIMKDFSVMTIKKLKRKSFWKGFIFGISLILIISLLLIIFKK